MKPYKSMEPSMLNRRIFQPSAILLLIVPFSLPISQMAAITTPQPNTNATIKFLCSYGGKILPRHPDGMLRYSGGVTRVLAVDRSLSFSELLVKLGKLCGAPVALRCQLPTEDLDALVSITSDEDLLNLIEEWDRATTAQPSSSLKIRAFLSLQKKLTPTSSIPFSTHGFSTSTASAIEIPSIKSPPSTSYLLPRFPNAATNHCIQQMLSLRGKHPFRIKKYSEDLLRYACESSSQGYVVHSGNHWQ